MNKQAVIINFAGGVDTKTDPYQLPIGEFLTLNNAVFDKAGGLVKRNGFPKITSIDADINNLTTLNGNLIATGSSLYAFNEQTNSWSDQGVSTHVGLHVQSMIKSNTAQYAPDSAITEDGLICMAYGDNAVAYYNIIDSVTGQQVVAKTALPTSSVVNLRVLLFNNFFIIIFTVQIAGTNTLQYIRIPIQAPGSPSAAITISNDINGLATGLDAIIANGFIYVAWGISSGTGVKMTRISNVFGIQTPVTVASTNATVLALTADSSQSPSVLWLAYYSSATKEAYVVAVSSLLTSILAQTKILAAADNLTLARITALAKNSLVSVYYEVENNYNSTGNYPTAVVTDYIKKLTVTQAGVIGATTVMLRSVGLASKAFFATNGTAYMLVAYGDTKASENPSPSNQPTYFLVDANGSIYLRLAASNGGGYTYLPGLAGVTQIDDQYYVPYLINDLLASVTKETNTNNPQVSNIYTQTGVNLAKFTISTEKQQKNEIASVLNLTGGLLWQYDGVTPGENNFNVYPEDVKVNPAYIVGNMTTGTYFFQVCYEWTDNQGNISRSAPSVPIEFISTAPVGTFQGNTNSNHSITAVSSFVGLQVGQQLTGTNLPANTFITVLDPGTSTITINTNATGIGTVTITPLAVSALDLYIPTLRLTYKTGANPARIVVYRWSVAQQAYHRITSVSAPVLNSTAVDYVTVTNGDTDATIAGNELIYTTGGVVENIAPPACIDSALYGNRMFLIDAEDPNLLWYSKQVIENTPIEFSDLFTFYVAPTTGAQGSTGPMTCISAMDDKFIMFKKDAIYYMTGKGPDNTGGNNDFSDPIFITSAVGCSNPNSIVLTLNGLMFQSDKGIWLLGRDLNTKYIGDRVEAYNDQEIVSALTLPGTNQVRFSLGSGTTLMFDYYYNKWGTFSNLHSVSDTLYQGMHTYLNTSGQIFQELENTYLDGSTPVLMNFTTGWLNVAGLRGFERFYYLFVLGTYFTPYKLNVQLAYNYSSSTQHSVLVTPDNYAPSWGGEATWGSGGPWGGVSSNVFQAKVNAKQQKCQTFQVSVNEIYDSTLGVPAGQGLSFSGLSLVIGAKKGWAPQKGSRSFG